MENSEQLNDKFLKMVELENTKRFDEAWKLANQLITGLSVWFYNGGWKNEDHFTILGRDEGESYAKFTFLSTLASTYYCMARIMKREEKLNDALAFAMVSAVLEPNEHVTKLIEVLLKKKGINEAWAKERSDQILKAVKR